MTDMSALFDVVRKIAGRGLTQAEVDQINAALSPPAKHGLAKPEAFFAGVRKVTGALDDAQVKTINDLLARAAHWSVGWLAYAFATAWHEARLKPIEEWGKGKGREYGKVNQTGKAPYGRGLVQLTWHRNYETLDKALGLNGKLSSNYDLALDADIAAQILVVGMERGLFTGKSLASYIAPGLGTQGEFINARRIINSTDKAAMIAGYAEHFKSALIAGGWA
jgi:putative chitinase